MGWHVYGLGHSESSRERERCWVSGVQFDLGKELTFLERLLSVPPRGQVSKFKERERLSGGHARVRLTQRPQGERPARGLRFALGLTIGAGMLPREELAAGCLFPALGRVRELDLFDFGVFGEEAFNGRRLHAWAARASPTCGEREAPSRRGKQRGWRVWEEAGRRKKRDKEQRPS